MARDAGSKSPSPKPNKDQAHPPKGVKRPKGAKHDKHHDSGAAKLASKLIGAAVLPVIFGVAGYHMYQKIVVLPGIVVTRAELPTILPADHFDAANTPDLFWGTYRSQLYFGVRARTADSPLIGLLWYEQPKVIGDPVNVRHWCDQSDSIKSYGWQKHDGRHFGVQKIVDQNIDVVTEFVKAPSKHFGGDWTARITATPNEQQPAHTTKDDDSEKVTMHHFVVYVSLPKGQNGYLRPKIVGTEQGGGGKSSLTHVELVEGYTQGVGKFRLKFSRPENAVWRSYLETRMEPEPDARHFNELILTGTGVVEMKQSKHLTHIMGLMGKISLSKEHPPSDNPNFIAVQMSVVKGTRFEIIYESVDNPQRVHEMSGKRFEEALAQAVKGFDEKFEEKFGLGKKGYPSVFSDVGAAALSNMLGSIGYFHGDSIVASEHTAQPVRYGPLTLFSTVPSRPFFPRGFLWDEGFHQLLIRRWDEDLSNEIVASWLDQMNVEGWIPREMILGAEAEAKVPAEFIVQRNDIANPPMLFYVIGRNLLSDRFVDRHRDYLRRVYPRLKLWYKWLNESQAGPVPGSYRWRGRNETTELELNPKTLASGLDDYPRASHPSSSSGNEYHLDLHCWMGLATKVLAKLAKATGAEQRQEVERLEAATEWLMQPDLLDQLHWSEKTGRYCDHGMHTRNVRLERKKLPPLPDGRPAPPGPMVRITSADPQARLVSDTFGYVSLFPFFLRLIPPESSKLGRLLEQLTDADLLWSPFGLRSLAKNAPLYNQRNTEHDPPYWRGAVWVNMNYMALSALKYYSEASETYADTSFKIYSDLRGALVQNIVKQYRNTGYLWEQYDDVTGAGKGCRPFTGWTSLVLLTMAEEYD